MSVFCINFDWQRKQVGLGFWSSPIHSPIWECESRGRKIAFSSTWFCGRLELYLHEAIFLDEEPRAHSLLRDTSEPLKRKARQSRSATTGSTLAARHAGIAQGMIATTPSRSVTSARVNGSRELPTSQ